MRSLALVLAVVVAGCTSSSGGPAALPSLVVALGDSITVAVNTAEQGEFPQHSWATGLAEGDGIASFAERLRELAPDVLAINHARSGARVAELADQARDAARSRPDLVLLLIGANDACAQPMTSTQDFRARLSRAADALPTQADVYALSIPDVTELHRAMQGNETASALWKAFRICPAVLGEGATDEDRAAVRARIEEYNAAIAAEARARGWSTDGGALFEEAYETAQVSSVDAFHPSLSGQARLAQVAWDAGPYASS